MSAHPKSHQFQLGKKPARQGAIKLKFSNYIDKSALPTPPANFGHETLFPAKGWGMLGNDSYGDCVWAGAGHETMMWNKEAGVTVNITDKAALSDYSAVTGFNPADPNTDQGTDMEVAAKYRRTTGIIDAAGKRHKVIAYLDLKPGDLAEHLLAAYIFNAVGIGIEFPSSAMDQFNAGKPWDVVSHAKVEGGHYIPFVAHRAALINVITWAQIQPMTTKFFSKYNDESIVYLTDENIKAGKTPEGFDMAALQADLKTITTA